ncbi:MAG: hypothetical protein HQK78_07010, partial [Desulfobacterales bacterium]|nr:hypothetical protein [Desulfobacterales bacterium]
EIDKLEAKIKDASEDVKVEYADEIKALQNHGIKAKAKLLEIQEASGDLFEEVKKGSEIIWSSLKDGFEKLKHKLK